MKKHFPKREPVPQLHFALLDNGYKGPSNSALAKLVAFAAQSPGMDPGDYGGENGAFRQDSASIAQDWARIAAVLPRIIAEHVTDADIILAAPQAFSGRLGWNGKDWEYCTGQYFPTEYRKAAATVLEYALRQVRRARPPQRRPVYTIEDLKDLNEINGGCWFEKSNMELFGTGIESPIFAGHYFVTSEKPPQGSRRFTLRSFNEEGGIQTVGSLYDHATLAQAIKAGHKDAGLRKKPRRAAVKLAVAGS